MDYLYDVFVSYKRHPEWTAWTRDHFRTLLEAYLTQSLPHPARIFVDERIEVGADWVDTLATSLARSRIMVAIFSADYFRAPWCIHELDLMVGRSVAASGANGLVFPIVVHDGELIPKEVRRIQMENLSEFRIAGMLKDTHDYHNFSKRMSKIAPSVAASVQKAPPFEEKWLIDAKTRLYKLFESYSAGATLDPQCFRSPNPQPPLTPPRFF